MQRIAAALDRHPWIRPVALVIAVVAAYAPSLRGSFLNYDDPWLIEHNSILARSDSGVFASIGCDLSSETRHVLGAEYLPIRDVSVWLDIHLFGMNAHWMRAVSLAIYVAAVLFLRAALRRTFTNGALAEVATWVFALHPVHVESVAWLAGRKDVLALAFVAAALWAHAARARRAVIWVPLLLLAAHLSKAQSVTAIGLLAATDLARRSKPDYRVYAIAGVVAATALAVDISVGHTVGMMRPLAGGSRWTAAATMGPVWLRYLLSCLCPVGLSIAYDVPVRLQWDVAAAAGWALLAGWAAVGWRRWRRSGESLVLVTWLWFVVPLVPVSQVIVPIDNKMTDRYLVFSVMAAALAAGALTARGATVARGTGRWVGVGLGLVLGGLTCARARLFADSASVFRDATAKTTRSLVAPYQLGRALEARGDAAGAEHAYRAVLRRGTGDEDLARRASNNLARLEVEAGHLDAAERLLTPAFERWPNDEMTRTNFAKVLARLGRMREAQAVLSGARARTTPSPTDANATWSGME